MSRKTKLSIASETIKQNLVLHADLTSRITTISRVVNNTLRKLTIEPHPMFNWVSSMRFTLVSYSIHDRWTHKDITKEILAGKADFHRNHEIHCLLKTFLGETHKAVIPFQLFNNDPVAIAQWVRTNCRRHYAVQMSVPLEKAQEELENAERRLIEAQKTLEALKTAKPVKPASK